ncbi:cupin domain-containing protein [Bordetella sp. 2513F-2]
MKKIPAPKEIPVPAARALRSADSTTKATDSVGFRVRALRRQKKLSLQQLKDATGLSLGLLSQIERDISSPSVRVLRLISDALGVEPIHFFEQNVKAPEHPKIVLRRNTQHIVHFAAGITKHALTHPGQELELFLVNMASGASSGDEPYTHPGVEAGYVITGKLKLVVESEAFVLEAGDSFSFKSTLPHRFENAADGDTQVLWSIAAPAYV